MAEGDLIGAWGQQIGSFFTTQIWSYLFYGTIIMAFLGWLYSKYNFIKTYKYPVRVYRKRENGKVKEANYLGAYVSVGGVTKFRVRTGKFAWNKKDLPTPPDPSGMDEDDRVYYYQINETTWVQIRRYFFDKQVVDSNGQIILDPNGLPVTASYVLFEPMPQSHKEMVVLELQQAKGILGIDKDVILKWSIGALVVIAITFIVAYYLMMNQGKIFE